MNTQTAQRLQMAGNAKYCRTVFSELILTIKTNIKW